MRWSIQEFQKLDDTSLFCSLVILVSLYLYESSKMLGVIWWCQCNRGLSLCLLKVICSCCNCRRYPQIVDSIIIYLLLFLEHNFLLLLGFVGAIHFRVGDACSLELEAVTPFCLPAMCEASCLCLSIFIFVLLLF